MPAIMLCLAIHTPTIFPSEEYRNAHPDQQGYSTDEDEAVRQEALAQEAQQRQIIERDTLKRRAAEKLHDAKQEGQNSQKNTSRAQSLFADLPTVEKSNFTRAWEKIKSFFNRGDLGDANQSFTQATTVAHNIVETKFNFQDNPNFDNKELLTTIKKCDSNQKEEVFNGPLQEMAETYKAAYQRDSSYLEKFDEKVRNLKNEIQASGMLNHDQRIEIVQNPQNPHDLFDISFRVVIKAGKTS